MALRILMMGVPKSGKTSSLASAANAGWTLRVLDFDGNVDPLIAHTDPAKRSNIQVVSCLEDFGVQQVLDQRTGNPKDSVFGLSPSKPPKAWQTMLDAMEKWPVDGSKPREWEVTKNVFVVDSLSTAAQARMRKTKFINGRQPGQKNFRDFGSTQEEIENFISALKVWIPCPVVIMAHIQVIGPDLEVDLEETIPEHQRGKLQAALLEQKLLEAEKTPWSIGPVSVGRAQVKTLAAHFNGAVLVEAQPAADRRVMITKPRDGLNLGLPFPTIKGKPTPREMALDTAMADILAAWVEAQGLKAA